MGACLSRRSRAAVATPCLMTAYSPCMVRFSIPTAALLLCPDTVSDGAGLRLRTIVAAARPPPRPFERTRTCSDTPPTAIKTSRGAHPEPARHGALEQGGHGSYRRQNFDKPEQAFHAPQRARIPRATASLCKHCKDARAAAIAPPAHVLGEESGATTLMVGPNPSSPSLMNYRLGSDQVCT